MNQVSLVNSQALPAGHRHRRDFDQGNRGLQHSVHLSGIIDFSAPGDDQRLPNRSRNIHSQNQQLNCAQDEKKQNNFKCLS